jgi:NADPH:quinone reductase-like Zn-dependent oxidoreductase
MRAVTVREYGGTPAVAEIPTPEPGARQILIRLRAARMNPMDLWLASGATKDAVLGFETAGVVDAIGGELSGSVVGRSHS